MKKKIFVIFGALIFIIILGVLLKDKKDYWNCENGEWIRHGSPKVSQPHTACPGKRAGQEMPSIPPDSTVVSFYTWLQKENTGLSEGEYKKSPYLTDNLNQTLSQGNKTENPFLCSNQPLISYKIIKSSVKERTASVEIEETFESEKKTVPMQLQAHGKEWKINDIKCPHL